MLIYVQRGKTWLDNECKPGIPTVAPQGRPNKNEGWNFCCVISLGAKRITEVGGIEVTLKRLQVSLEVSVSCTTRTPRMMG